MPATIVNIPHYSVRNSFNYTNWRCSLFVHQYVTSHLNGKLFAPWWQSCNQARVTATESAIFGKAVRTYRSRLLIQWVGQIRSDRLSFISSLNLFLRNGDKERETMASKSRDQRIRIKRSLMAFIVLTPTAWGVLGQIQNTRALASTGSGQNTQAAANYNKAMYYEQNQNYYNAVYYASQALAGGDTKAQTILDDASNALLKQAENQYQAGNISTAIGLQQS